MSLPRTIPVICVVMVAVLPLALGSGQGKTPLSPRASAILTRAIADSDPAVPRRVAALLGAEDLVAGLYQGNRAQKLVAIDAAGYLADPWPVLPYITALMETRDREIGSRAANAVLIALRPDGTNRIQAAEVLAAQAEQLANQVGELAANVRLDVDIRASALSSLGLLQMAGFDITGRFEELLTDEQIAVRRAALSLVVPPLSPVILKKLAQAVIEEQNSGIKAQSAVLLCENALDHGVRTPSPDLVSLLKAVLANHQTPPWGVVSLINCLTKFQAGTRFDLIDMALKHPDPEIGAFWDRQKKYAR